MARRDHAPANMAMKIGLCFPYTQETLDRDLTHLRDRLAPEVAEMVYYGFWYHAKLDALSQAGLMQADHRGIRATSEGRQRLNAILATIIA